MIINQMSSGSLMFIYIAEISRSDTVMGTCMLTCMVSQMLQGMCTTYIINSWIGVIGLFAIFSLINLIAFLFIIIFVKETKGLN